jgi:PAS domain S-box-containing protein
MKNAKLGMRNDKCENYFSVSHRHRLTRRILLASFFFFLTFVSGCTQAAVSDDEAGVQVPFASFKDIPGVTAEEIAAIEELQRKYQAFYYGMTLTTEAFTKENGEGGEYAVDGYAALFCQWLSSLFGIMFQPEVYAWNDLLDKLNAGTLDFAGNLIITEERKKMYHMTGAIAERQYKLMRLKGSPALARITQERPLRYAFLESAVHNQNVASVMAPGAYEPVWVKDYTEVYDVLARGDADAFIAENAMEASFSAYDNMYIEDFLPLIFSPIAMATAKDELKPVISVINKAQKNGIMPYLNNLYNQGYEAYKKNKFFMLLSEKEKTYLRNTVSVPLLYQYFNYPIAFYDSHNKRWDGIAMDLLHEVEKLTGLTFEVVNGRHTEMSELIPMLADGSGHIFVDLIHTKEREPYFIWNKNKFMADQYALLSKIDYPNVNTNEIPYKRIALVLSTAHKEMFHTWFPNAANTTEYINLDDAFMALEQGKADLLMAAKTKLLYYLNYHEFPDYKANYLFNYSYESAFAFNKDQTDLCSIVDKAISIINTDVVVEQWITKTYDFRAQLAEARLPWLIGVIALFFVVLVLVLVLFYRGRNLRKQKESDAMAREADAQTKLMLEYAPLVVMLWDTNFQILDCNQEAIKIFGLSNKEEFKDRFMDLAPEYQPNGKSSQEMFLNVRSLILKETEFAQMEWAMCHAVTGEEIPFAITLIHIKYKDEDAILAYGLDLRERNASLAKIREADERAQLMLEQAPLVVMLWSESLQILDCNQEAVRVFGLSSKKEYIDRFMEFAPEYQPNGITTQELFLKAQSLIFKEKEFAQIEWTQNHAVTGEPIPFAITLVRIKYKDGYAALSYGQDLRELRASTKLVMEKSTILEAILDTAPDLIFVKDLDSRYIRCNKSFESLMGCSCEDIIGKDDAEGLNAPPEVAAAFVAEDTKIFEKKEKVIFEDYILASDGTKVLFETVKSPLVINGKMTGLVGVARDVTHRKAIEEEVIRQYSLMDTVNMAAAVLLEPGTDGGINAINYSMEMVCQSVGADRVFLWQNISKDDGSLHYKQLCKWTRPEYAMGDDLPEYSYEEAMPEWKDQLFAGQNINGPLDTLPGYDPEIFSIYAMQSILIVPLFLKGEYWGFVSFDDCRNRRFFPQADEHILRSWGLLVVGATRRAKMMLDLEHAVEEAKRASSEAMKAYAEAETALEAKSRFIANMNHEMRTPMNVIVGLTDLLLEEKEVSGKAKETLHKINIAGNTLMGLINDVLDISKAEAGKMDLMTVEYDVASMLNDIIALNSIRAEDKPIEFKLDIDKNLPVNLFGDDLRVKQILNNLLSNAFKYTKIGNVTLGVSCQREGRRQGDYVWLSFSVSDSGIGIRKEDVEKLFTDYNQVDTRTNREIEGTGLGLSITKKLVELMEGEISVESEYGKGSVFSVRIRQGFVTDKPIGAETVQSLSSFRYSDEKRRAQKKLVRSDLSYARVLVVDDFPTNLDVAEGMLRKYKMQVDCVTSGQESIDLIAAGEPVYNAVFMDHMMPGMDGVEAAKAIRALGTQYAQDIPIIALTANAVVESEKMFLENGFNAFLPKPFNVIDLDSVVQRWVRDRAREN